jgi:hypothetical protein
MRKLEVYNLGGRDTDTQLKPSLEDELKRFTLKQKLRRLWCWFPRRVFISDTKFYWDRHFYGGWVYYQGTAKEGTGWRVCSRCGHKIKYGLVREDT